MMIDTHTHLDMDIFSNDLESIIKDSNIEFFIIPGACLSTISNAINISKKYANVYFASGLHPNDASEDLQSLEILKRNSEVAKCVAIGECGLDFYYLDKNDINFYKKIDRQIEAFCYQIELSLECNLPLILHVRDSRDNFLASQKVCEILQTYKNKYKEKLRGVFHCFNAYEKSLDFMDSFYYGIGGIVTFKNAKVLVNILPFIKDRIILETDSPYLAPVPHRGKRNEPKFLEYISLKVAEILNISQNEVIVLTSINAKELFRI